MVHFSFCLSLLAQFQIWDGIITQTFVKNGLVKEGNQWMMSLINNGDFWWFKALSIVFVLTALWIVHKRLPRFSTLVASCLAVFYIGIVSWNFLVFFHCV